MKCIQLDNLRLTYRRGKVRALDGIHLEIDHSSFLGLCGPNGAGKSTLIRILAGLIRHDHGRIRLFEQEISSGSYAHRQRIGFVLDKPTYIERLTCKEFLRFAGAMYNVPREQTESRVEELLRFFDLSDVEERLIETYSKGMKQKVSLAAAVIHEPELLVLDEPFDGIDPKSTEEIRQMLLQMNQKGITIVITTHILEWIESLCTECAIIHKGRVVFQSRMDRLESQLKRLGNSEKRATLKEIFLQVTSEDRPHNSLSWLT